jgi:hypothetical protein
MAPTPAVAATPRDEKAGGGSDLQNAAQETAKNRHNDTVQEPMTFMTGS